MKAAFNALDEPLIFEISGEGKEALLLPEPGVPERIALPPDMLRNDLPGFPEVSEVEITRHFTRLSQLNYCVDKGLYPLGSCTMKYNPKVNEKVASMNGFLSMHPGMPEEMVQGNMELMFELEKALAEITGMDGFTLSPLAGAHGELAGMLMIRAWHISQGNPRKKVLIPDSAHGTNPSSAHISGYEVEEIPSNHDGTVDIERLKEIVDEDVAALMLTNPNTLGIFEKDIKVIADILHKSGALLYMDGANLNALMGIARPGDMGVDVIHVNVHKTLSTPHGGGGPGAGPVGVKSFLEPFLPLPVIERNGDSFAFSHDRPSSIGRIGGNHGNFLVLVKTLAYILSMGPEGLREASVRAVLNSNYIRSRLEGSYHLPFPAHTLHECVFSDKDLNRFGIKAMDVAKRLIDYGFHPPTVSFPLIVHGALMIEPTETESKREIDLFVDAMKEIAREAGTDPEILKSAPHTTPVSRLDEAQAAKKQILTWNASIDLAHKKV